VECPFPYLGILLFRRLVVLLEPDLVLAGARVRRIMLATSRDAIQLKAPGVNDVASVTLLAR
jgi:hypothetical protein